MPQNVFDGNVARRRIPRFSMCRASRFDDEGHYLRSATSSNGKPREETKADASEFARLELQTTPVGILR
jgi:hypothetical protein